MLAGSLFGSECWRPRLTEYKPRANVARGSSDVVSGKLKMEISAERGQMRSLLKNLIGEDGEDLLNKSVLNQGLLRGTLNLNSVS